MAGSYDNEGIAIFCMLLTYALWVKSVKTGSLFWGTLCSLAYFYMVSGWGITHPSCTEPLPLRCRHGEGMYFSSTSSPCTSWPSWSLADSHIVYTWPTALYVGRGEEGCLHVCDSIPFHSGVLSWYHTVDANLICRVSACPIQRAHGGMGVWGYGGV